MPMTRKYDGDPLKRDLVCRSCRANWHYEGKTRYTNCPFCGVRKCARDYSRRVYKDPEKRIRQLRELIRDKEFNRSQARKWYRNYRKQAFFKVSGSITPCCVRCGCDDVRLLEINHKNGGGGKERLNGLTRAVATGARQTDDLELLCRPCNAIHALELRFGPLPFRVVWTPTIGGNSASH